MKRQRTRDKEAVPVFVAEQIGAKRSKTPEGFLFCEDVPIARIGVMQYSGSELPLEPGKDGTIRVTRDEDTLFEPAALASYSGKPVVNEHPEDDVGPANWRELAVGIVMNPRRGEGADSDVMMADLLITDKHAIRDVEAGKREVSAGYDADYEQISPGEGRQVCIRGNHVALVERGRCGPRCAIGDHQPMEQEPMSKTTTTTVVRRPTIAESIRKVFRDAEEGLLDTFGGAKNGANGDDEPSGDTHIHIHAGGDGPVGANALGGADRDDSDPSAAGGSAMGAGPQGKSGIQTEDDPVEARFQSLEQGHAKIIEQLGQLQAALNKLSGDDDGDAGTTAVAGDEAGEQPGVGEATGEEDGAGGEDMTAMDALPEELEAAKKGKTMDSQALDSSFRAVLADAEVLVPGVRVPAFNPKAPRKKTMDSMCSLRRSVLTTLKTTRDGEKLLDSVAPIRDVDKATCVAVATAFRAAAGAKRLLNNSASTQDAHRLPGGSAAGAYGTAAPQPRPKITSIADLNRLHNAHYAPK